jgi:hypothetical protein
MYQDFNGRTFETQADAQDFINNQDTIGTWHIMKSIEQIQHAPRSAWPMETYRDTMGRRRLAGHGTYFSREHLLYIEQLAMLRGCA